MDGSLGRRGKLEAMKAVMESETDQSHRLIEMTSILIANWKYFRKVSKVSQPSPCSSLSC